MKLFCLHIIKIVIILIISLYGLDFTYSKLYSQSKHRNKIQFALNENPKHYDVVFLGTSRANNHFVSSEFNKKGYNSFNFGLSGSSLQDTYLLLNVLIEKKNTIKNVVLEIDLNIRDDIFSGGTRALFMPYINTNPVVHNFYKRELDDYNANVYFPFYRYIRNENKIGFRELLFTLFDKKSDFIENKGYTALYGTQNGMSSNLNDKDPKRNRFYEEIKRICKENKIKLIVVMTPMCENTKGLEYFEKVNQLYPEIHNFENVVKDDKYFSSCGHLNDEGAKKFTTYILQNLF